MSVGGDAAGRGRRAGEDGEVVAEGGVCVGALGPVAVRPLMLSGIGGERDSVRLCGLRWGKRRSWLLGLLLFFGGG